MFSSLPSASKLYVCSTSKIKQKNAGISQRKRRVRKSKIGAARVGSNVETDTLISSVPDSRESNANSENYDEESFKGNRIVRFSENTITYCEDFHSEGESSIGANVAEEGAFHEQLSSELSLEKENLQLDECVTEENPPEQCLKEKFSATEEIITAVQDEKIQDKDPTEHDVLDDCSATNKTNEPLDGSSSLCASVAIESLENKLSEQVNEQFSSCESFAIELVTVEELSSDDISTAEEVVESNAESKYGKSAETILENNLQDRMHVDEANSLCAYPSVTSVGELNTTASDDQVNHNTANAEETQCLQFSLESVDSGIQDSVTNTVSSLNDSDANLERNTHLEPAEKPSSPLNTQNKHDAKETELEPADSIDSVEHSSNPLMEVNNKSSTKLDQSSFNCLQTVYEVDDTTDTSPTKCTVESAKDYNLGSSTYNSITSNFSASDKSLQKYPELRGSSSSLRTPPDVRAKVSALSRTNSLPENCFKLGRSIDILTPPGSVNSVPSNSSVLSNRHTVAMSTPLKKSDDNGNGYSCLSESDDSVNVPEPPHSYVSSIENISTISSAISSLLPPVTVKEARLRSFVVGSVRASGSLLGVEELMRYFPDRKVNIFVGTWNMNGLEPPDCIDDFLLPLGMTHLPDIYAIGVQESYQSRNEWEVLLQSTLGPSHVLFTSASIGVLHLAIFLRRDLVWFCSKPEDASMTTRPGSMVKTKGAVAVSFMFFGTSFLFINSHLTAHERKLKERLADYEKIISVIDLPKTIPLKPQYQSKDVTARFDNVFWCGDLNFRVVQDRPVVLHFVENRLKEMIRTCDFLLQHDQLQQAMNQRVAFHGFEEGVIDFVPSYKFDIGTNSFDSNKQRVPSYTDRVLYRCKQKGSILCTHYNSVSNILTSDHKPVFATFEVIVKPGRDNIPLAAGLFKRDVYLEAIRKRSMALEITSNQGNSRICSIM